MIEKPDISIRETKDPSTSKASLRVVSDRVAQSYASVLKNARQKSNLSIVQVAEALHVSRYIIEALESKRYAKLPAEIYVTGYIRSYAALLGLNPEGLVRDFRQDKEQCELTEALRLDQERIIAEQARAAKDPAFDKNIRLWAVQVSAFMVNAPLIYKLASGFIMIAVLFLLILQKNAVSEQPVSNSIEQVKVLTADGSMLVTHLLDSHQEPVLVNDVAVGNENAQAMIEAGKDQLALTFTGTSWVTVRDYERVLMHQSRKQNGDTLELTGTAPFYLKLSKASAVDVFFNKQKIDFSAQVSDDDQVHELPLMP